MSVKGKIIKDGQDTGTDILTEGIRRLGIPPPVLPLLSKYIEEIERFNPAYGLVKVRDRRELIVRHILDSLSPLGAVSRIFKGRIAGGKIADAGSGAGFPGLPLAIALPEARFTLIERMGRRAGFLRNCLAALSLPNVTVEEGEIEKSSPCRFDLVVFRAFRPLEAPVLRDLFRLLLPGGFLAAYKGRRQVVEEELKTVEAAVPTIAGAWEIIPLEVPFLDEERHLALLYSGPPRQQFRILNC
jgi:16S rRNA (guanine527-N7)-methyltransferase